MAFSDQATTDPVAAALSARGLARGARLAVGGTAEIFAVHRNGDCPLVLKSPLPESEQRPELGEMLRREAALHGALSHPNLARLEGVIDGAHGVPHLLLEYVHGPSLRALLDFARREATPLPLAAVGDLFAQLLDALAYLHAARAADGQPLHIVHRDLSPHNVLIATSGRVVLSDLGTAQAETIADRTRTGLIKGKLKYLAPEQATCSAVDARTDLYAVGLLLFETVTGEAFLDGRSDAELLRQAEAPATDARLKDWPAEAQALRPIAKRCLATFREARFADAHEVKRALLSAVPGGAPTEALARYLEAAPNAPWRDRPMGPRAPATSTGKARPPPRSWWGRGAVIALGAGALFAAFLSWPATPPHPPSVPRTAAAESGPVGPSQALDPAQLAAPSTQPPATEDRPAPGAPRPIDKTAPDAAAAGPAAGAHTAGTEGRRNAPAEPQTESPKPKAESRRPHTANTRRPAPSARRTTASQAAAPVRDAPTPQAVLEALDRRGILRADLSETDRALLLRAESKSGAAARTDRITFAEAAARIRIDRPFVQRKLARLHQKLLHAQLPDARRSAADAEKSRALEALIEGRLEATNRHLNALQKLLAEP